MAGGLPNDGLPERVPSSRRWRSAGWVLGVVLCLLVAAVVTSSLTGCGGCRKKTAAEKKKEEAERKKKEEEERKRRERANAAMRVRAELVDQALERIVGDFKEEGTDEDHAAFVDAFVRDVEQGAWRNT